MIRQRLLSQWMGKLKDANRYWLFDKTSCFKYFIFIQILYVCMCMFERADGFSLFTVIISDVQWRYLYSFAFMEIFMTSRNLSLSIQFFRP